MHDRLAVNNDSYAIVRYTEEMVCLNGLETLVHHRGRVCRDLGSHPPRRVLQSVLRTYLSKLCLRSLEERPSRSGQQYLAHLPFGSPEEALEDRRVLRIDGYYA